MDTVDLGPAAERLADLVTRVTADELGQPTPCPAPAAMVGLTAADELVVHGSDVAHATGQPYTCVPDLLDAARTFLALFASPDAQAGPDVPFGPCRSLPGDAPLLDRVVALAGRDPGWRPS